MDTAPLIQRQRHETRRRQLLVTRTTRLTPNMLRLRLEGPEMEGFVSTGADDHIKLFVPDGTGGQAMRDYTPRAFDAASGWLEIDFALHGPDSGPATLWALAAKPGDRAEIGGPRGSRVVSHEVEDWLLVGDETALPAIARRIQELPAGVRVTSLVAIPGPEDEQAIQTAARHRAIWVHRADPTDAEGLLKALPDLLPGSQGFAWIAAEAQVARRLKSAVLDLGFPASRLLAAGYWVAGEADASAKDL